ncbi:MAG: hypothetical protein ACYC27_08780 [Armatimonadota bacterium]
MVRRQFALLAGIVLAMTIMCSAFPAAAQTERETEKKISVNFKDVPIQNAIEVLFEGTGLNYAIEPGVRGTVNVRLVDVPFSDALTAVLKASSMTVRKENGIYTIGPLREAATEVAGPTVDIPEIERQKILEKIPIGYADVYDIGAVFGVQPVGSRASSMTGSGGGGFGGNSGSSFGNSSNNNSNSNSGGGFGGNSGSSFGNRSSGSSGGGFSGGSSGGGLSGGGLSGGGLGGLR